MLTSRNFITSTLLWHLQTLLARSFSGIQKILAKIAPRWEELCI